MVGFTKGPWRYGIRKDGSLWLSLGDPKVGRHFQGDLAASEADARLIAEAPAMYEALKDAEYALDNLMMAFSDGAMESSDADFKVAETAREKIAAILSRIDAATPEPEST